MSASVAPVQEVLPGIHHWATRHPRIGVVVSSYWLEDAGVLFDPLVPAQEGLDWFAARPVLPGDILLSNRHHYRESGAFAERFGCTIHCNSAGLHEFSHGEPVRGFEIGDELPGGVVAHEMGAICPDDTALYLPSSRALVLADSVVLGGPRGREGLLGFVPDSLMDDPPHTKAGILASCSRLLAELDFEHLLLAHGGPLIGDGRSRLQDLVDSGGRTAFEV